jgi:hypothetical protein
MANHLKSFLVFGILVVLVFVSTSNLWAQCAMCAASIESNLKESKPGIGLSINDGILYLMMMPYLMFGLFGYLWYRNSKRKKA